VDEAQSFEDRIRGQEDWLTTLLGFCIVCIILLLFINGHGMNWLAVAPEPWSSLASLRAQLERDWLRYLFQFLGMLTVFSAAAALMARSVVSFAAGFILVYGLSFVTLAVGAWDFIHYNGIEPPLIALALGAMITNIANPAAWSGEAFRAELYLKMGIVVLGATLPLTLILWAGPIAIIQVSIVTILTFLAIYGTSLFLELDRRLAALLAAGGAVCGVSAVVAVAGAIRPRREDMSIAVVSVAGWSMVLILVMPLLARAWYLPAGVAGAWIGTSELAEATGLVAAHSYGGFAAVGAVTGTPEQALRAFTLLKGVGRDAWITLWVLILSFVSVTRWEPGRGARLSPATIWRRFPKCVLGLVATSLLATLASATHGHEEFNAVVQPTLIAPLVHLRTWIFTFSFLSIGLTTRLRGLAPAGGTAFIAFATGVMVNLVIGFMFSAVIFEAHWAYLEP
jgi:uncharacterized membrane protein YadS